MSNKNIKAFKLVKNDGYVFDRYSTTWSKKFEKYEKLHDNIDTKLGDFTFFDKNHKSQLRPRGISVEVSVWLWKGNPLYFVEDKNIIKEKTCGGTKKLKIVIPKSGHTNYGGRIFIGEYNKCITIWAWDVEEMPCSGCHDCLNAFISQNKVSFKKRMEQLLCGGIFGIEHDHFRPFGNSDKYDYFKIIQCRKCGKIIK